MDKSSKQPQMNEYQQDLINNANIDEEKIRKQYIEENGNLYRVPYRIVKKVIFTDVDKKELKDIPHAARLQYRLMLNDAILKAIVQFSKGRIIIIYNPKSADNLREKISLEEIIDFLASEGVKVQKEKAIEEDFDYYRDFYSYAFNPKQIREHAPYGYSLEEWRKMKPSWEARLAEGRKKSREKFEQWQQSYLEEHPELAAELGVEIKKPEARKSLLGFRKKRKSGEKGFWFHGA